MKTSNFALVISAIMMANSVSLAQENGEIEAPRVVLKNSECVVDVHLKIMHEMETQFMMSRTITAPGSIDHDVTRIGRYSCEVSLAEKKCRVQAVIRGTDLGIVASSEIKRIEKKEDGPPHGEARASYKSLELDCFVTSIVKHQQTGAL